jgi:hypothetical protein
MAIYSTNEFTLDFLTTLVNGPQPPPTLTNTARDDRIAYAFNSIGETTGWTFLELSGLCFDEELRQRAIAFRLIGTGDFVVTYRQSSKNGSQVITVIDFYRHATSTPTPVITDIYTTNKISIDFLTTLVNGPRPLPILTCTARLDRITDAFDRIGETTGWTFLELSGLCFDEDNRHHAIAFRLIGTGDFVVTYKQSSKSGSLVITVLDFYCTSAFIPRSTTNIYTTNKISINFLTTLVNGPPPPRTLTYTARDDRVTDAFDRIGETTGWTYLELSGLCLDENRQYAVAFRLIGTGDFVVTYKQSSKTGSQVITVIDVYRHRLPPPHSTPDIYSTDKITINFLTTLVNGPPPPPTLTSTARDDRIADAFDRIGETTGWTFIELSSMCFDKENRQHAVAFRLIGTGDFVVTYKQSRTQGITVLSVY